MCLKIYEINPAKFPLAAGLAWQAAFKKSKVKLMVEKVIRGQLCHYIYKYAKANNKNMKDHDKNNESSYIQYSDVNNL